MVGIESLNVKIMKSASVTKTKGGYLLNSQSKTTDGVWIATGPFITIDFQTLPDQLTEKLLYALNCSRENVPHPKNWKEFNTDFLTNIKAKSRKAFYKDAKYCEISESDNILVFLPTRNVDQKGWFDHLPELETKAPMSNADEIHDAMQRAFENCK